MRNKKLLKPTILRIKKIKNNNGTLIPLYFNKFRSFKAKRIFIVKGKPYLKEQISTLEDKVTAIETENTLLKSIIDKLKNSNSFEEFKNSL